MAWTIDSVLSSLTQKFRSEQRAGRQSKYLASALKLKSARVQQRKQKMTKVRSNTAHNPVSTEVVGRLADGGTVRLNPSLDAQVVRLKAFEATSAERFKERMALLRAMRG